MSDADAEYLTRLKLNSLRAMWSGPDESKGDTWEFDGVPRHPEHWMSYSHEMREGLGTFGCKTFDELVLHLGQKLHRKITVIDLMGGAYFLENPEETESFAGIRVHNKDEDFIEEYKDDDTTYAKRLTKITQSPNRKVLEADVLTVDGWKKIQDEHLKRADLLVCRPVGPFDRRNAMVGMFDDPKSYIGLYTSLFKRMISLVNKEDGVVFTEIPDIYSDREVAQYFAVVDRNEKSHTTIYTVPDKDYQWGGIKRRYAVMQY